MTLESSHTLARHHQARNMRQDSLFPMAREGDPVEGAYAVKRVTFENKETGFAVVHLVPADQPNLPAILAVGPFVKPLTGACYDIVGVWRHNERYGMQVRVSSAEPKTPQSAAAIENYLAGASIKGLGPHFARVLVEHFGQETFAMLQEGGTRLEEAPGIGPTRAQWIRDSWAEHQGIHELMVNLQGVAGLSPSQAQRIYQQYGRDAWKRISRDPYQLTEVRGFGFIRCDRIARKLGIAPNAPERIRAGVVYLLGQALGEGHLYATSGPLGREATELLGLVDEDIKPQIAELVRQERVIALPPATVGPEAEEGQRLLLPRVALTEERMAARLSDLLRAPCSPELALSTANAQRLIDDAASDDNPLTEEQRGAIAAVLCGTRLSILTGGPGTGKTTTIRTLLDCLDRLNISYALCATTGRASKQLASSSGREASTVHRHLRIGFGNTPIVPVNETVLIVDESSMIDLWLMDQIVARLDTHTHVLLVGDIDQLPSVGPGAILQDLITAGEVRRHPGIHVTRLTRIFRQEAGDRSMIVVNCHRVRQGQLPIADVPKTSDYYQMLRETPAEARELAIELASTRLPKYLDIPPSEVQVLTPMHSGEAGIRALNIALQQALNPPHQTKNEIRIGGIGRNTSQQRILRVGDKVRQTRNNYHKRVFNGDLGIMTQIIPAEKRLMVDFGDHPVGYTFEELDELVHSWAMTVHAAQGSQWPAVVVIMLKNHYVMLERNILYTALSRAQRLAVLLTQDMAVRIAVSQDRSVRRRTMLVERLYDEAGRR